jgi:hypothetical protein
MILPVKKGLGCFAILACPFWWTARQKCHARHRGWFRIPKVAYEARMSGDPLDLDYSLGSAFTDGVPFESPTSSGDGGILPSRDVMGALACLAREFSGH